MTVVDKRAMGVSGPGGVRATAAVDSPLSMQVELPWDTSEREIGPRTESELAAACLELIGDEAVLSAAERDLAKGIPASARKRFDIEPIRDAITHGQDPLGAAFSSLRSAALRRTSGAVYTPATITRSIVAWLAGRTEPSRIVDPGAGSGRFILAAGEAFPRAQLVAVETDPLAALMLRANTSVRGWIDRTILLVDDYRQIELPPCSGVTAFIGNPPYVRHHDIGEHWKAWYTRAFASFGIKASALAGLLFCGRPSAIVGRPPARDRSADGSGRVHSRRAQTDRRFSILGGTQRCRSRLCRPPSQSVVGGRAEAGGSDSVHLHGSPLAAVHAQCVRRASHQCRAWALSARAALACSDDSSGGVAQRERLHEGRTDLRGWFDEVRAERGRTPAHSTYRSARRMTSTPPRWTAEELADYAAISAARFRADRLAISNSNRPGDRPHGFGNAGLKCKKKAPRPGRGASSSRIGYGYEDGRPARRLPAAFVSLRPSCAAAAGRRASRRP